MANKRGLFLLAILLTISISSIVAFAMINERRGLEPEGVEFSAEQVAEAKKHKAYQVFYDADAIVIGKATFRLDGVAESFPAIYEYTVSVRPTAIISGRYRGKGVIRIRHSIISEADPVTPTGKECIVAIKGKGQPWISFIEANDAELKMVAQVAVQQRQAKNTSGLEQARNAPAKHPLFAALKAAEGVAIVSESTDPEGTVSFSSETNLSYTTCLIEMNVQGELKEATEQEIGFANGAIKTEPGHLFVIIYSKEEDHFAVSRVLPADEEILTVASAVFKEKDEELRELRELIGKMKAAEPLVEKSESNDSNESGGIIDEDVSDSN